MAKLIKIINTISFDWKYHKARFLLETGAMICAFLFCAIFSYYGDQQTFISAFTLFVLEMTGAICGIGYGIYRDSINIVFINLSMLVLSILGLVKLLW